MAETTPRTGSTATDETDQLISSTKVEGTAVYNRQGERLGTVASFMVNKRSGLLGVSGVSADIRDVLKAADEGNSNAWLAYDRFMVAADFDAYWKAQREVDALWRSPRDWWRMSVLNTARMGWFSSDRAVRDYARDIWHVGV